MRLYRPYPYAWYQRVTQCRTSSSYYDVGVMTLMKDRLTLRRIHRLTVDISREEYSVNFLIFNHLETTLQQS
jgi:hypothetical protein